MSENITAVPGEGATRLLAEACAGIRYDALPRKVVDKAKLCILDYVANVYGSLQLEAVRKTAAYIRSLASGGQVTAMGLGFKTDLHHAAFINGTLAEAIEAQDGVRFGGNHPGVSVIPAAFALAEQRKLNGKKVIEAVVAGYEAANRIAAAMHPWHTLGGFLPTGTCGAFGAAAAAGRLMDLAADQMAGALGSAGYLLPVSTAETLMGGYPIKIVQGGQGASAGLMAAGLAEAGVPGAPYIVEGSQLNGGFAKITTAAAPDFTRLTRDLGTFFTLEDVYFKPYTACRHTHGAAQAALALRAEHHPDLDEIESVTVFSYGIAQLAVGKALGEDPTFVSAQFSIPWVVAACLADGELGPAQLTERRLEDRELVAFSGRVRVETDQALNAAYPEKTASRVEIRLKNNTLLTRQVDMPKGDPRDPMTGADIIRKLQTFAGNGRRDAGVNASPGTIDEIADQILNLESMSEISALAEAI